MAPPNLLRSWIPSFRCFDLSSNLCRSCNCHELRTANGRKSRMVVERFHESGFYWSVSPIVFVLVPRIQAFSGRVPSSDGLFNIHVNDGNHSWIMLWRGWVFILSRVQQSYLFCFESRLKILL